MKIPDSAKQAVTASVTEFMNARIDRPTTEMDAGSEERIALEGAIGSYVGALANMLESGKRHGTDSTLDQARKLLNSLIKSRTTSEDVRAGVHPALMALERQNLNTMRRGVEPETPPLPPKPSQPFMGRGTGRNPRRAAR